MISIIIGVAILIVNTLCLINVVVDHHNASDPHSKSFYKFLIAVGGFTTVIMVVTLYSVLSTTPLV